MPNWTGVITNAGSLLLSEWVNEKILTITSAQAGTGTVPTVALMGQTALVNPKQAAVIAGGGEIEGGKRVNLQVTAAETAYTLNQFGLYAKVDDGSPVLLAIYQNEEGVPIPALSDTPDFLYTFMAAISVSNQGAWEVTISASASLTWDLVGVPNGIAGLDENGKVPASQLPEMDYIPSGEKGKKNGVATLGADGKLSDGQVPDASKVPYNNESMEVTNVKQALDHFQTGLGKVGDAVLTYGQQTVQTTAWTEDQTLVAAGYGYRAPVPLEGMTGSHIPTVNFSASDASSGNMAPVADSYDGGVYIFAKAIPEAVVTIVSVEGLKGVNT